MAMKNYRQFLFLLVAVVSVGFVSIVFVLQWVLYFKEGLAWDGGLAEFNWHPVLIVTGFIFIQGIAILVYRLPWTWKCSKLMMKFIHAGLNILAFAFAAISLVAVFDFHNAASIPNMYSLHSWLGLTAVILYGLQIALGLCVYLVPIIPESMRAVFMPVHVYSGLLIFTSVIATALMGITEKLIFGLKNPKYKDSPPEATFVNFLGVLIMVFGALVIWIVTCPAWKRPNEQLLSSQPTSGGDATRTMGGTVLSICSTTDWNDPEANCDTRKRNNKPDQSGQRSTV
ncbi:plasma membrane ascorbate-dependent reductase CYBRD1 [Conger conger]|uniref:plasma membrane ascorbate-dependent reductase CYBRD1 n=1 Tax=Conger conger TaxID=82655 RepID=UPI002A5AA80C|nr:plasma membrane ascorbate-dependent reductase CYBRD1 [Conger conger]